MYLTATEFLARVGGLDAFCAYWELTSRSSRADIREVVDATLNIEGINLHLGDRMTVESIGDIEAIVVDHLRPPAQLLPRHRIVIGSIGALAELSTALRDWKPRV